MLKKTVKYFLITLLLCVGNTQASPSISILEKHSFCTRFGEQLAEAVEFKLMVPYMDITDSSYEVKAREEAKKYGSKNFKQWADNFIITVFSKVLSQPIPTLQDIVDDSERLNTTVAGGFSALCKQHIK